MSFIKSPEQIAYEELLDAHSVLKLKTREAKKCWLESLKPGDLAIHGTDLIEFVGRGRHDRFGSANVRFLSGAQRGNIIKGHSLCHSGGTSPPIATIPYDSGSEYLQLAMRLDACLNSKDNDRQVTDALSGIAPEYIQAMAKRIIAGEKDRKEDGTIHQWAQRPRD